MATGRHILENAGGFLNLVAVIIALLALNTWKREYKFKRDSELLEEALILFYQAEHAIVYLRDGFIFSDELQDFEFPPELEDDYSKEKYKYTHTIRKRFDEKQHIFDKLYAIEFRFRARFGYESIAEFSSMKKSVKELLLAANQYSIKGLSKEEITKTQEIIWKDYHKSSKEGDVFGNSVNNIVKDFDELCRKKLQ